MDRDDDCSGCTDEHPGILSRPWLVAHATSRAGRRRTPPRGLADDRPAEPFVLAALDGGVSSAECHDALGNDRQARTEAPALFRDAVLLEPAASARNGGGNHAGSARRPSASALTEELQA